MRFACSRAKQRWCLLLPLLCLGVVQAELPGGVGAAQAGQPASSSTDSSSDSVESGPEALKEQVRITVETNVPPATTGTNAAPKERSFDWKISWESWDGLHLQLSQKTPIEDPFASFRAKLGDTNVGPIFHLEKIQMSGKIGANVAVDAAAFVTSPDFQDFDSGFQLRRARIYAKGDCLLLLPVSYELELGYIPRQFYIEKSYLAFKNISYIGELKLGQFQAPMGLEVVTSSRDITFMEPATVIQALAPGVNAGIEMGHPVFNRRATWALGFFTDGVGQDFGDASQNYGRCITRFTGLPLWHPSPDDSSQASLLHLGASANLLYSASSTVRYQARPESHIAPYVVDTEDINANSAAVFGAEVAWVHGPFSLQAEYLHSIVNLSGSTNYSRANFDGFYLSSSFFLTGESRPYDRTEGKFARVIPKHDFNWGKGGWGAWEIAGRLSWANLSSADVDGGRVMMLMTGVNWYLHPHVKWRFSYGFGRVSDYTPDGNINIFQTRVEVDF